MAEKTFTQAKIIGNARILGLGYQIIWRNEILLIGEEEKIRCTIDRINDGVRAEGIEGSGYFQFYYDGKKFFKFMAQL